MKTWKLVTSALLVLAGFSAGVGLNFISMSGTVHGAPGTPVVTKPPVPADPQHQDDGNSGGNDHGGPGDSNAALKTVTHNATLAGDGTTKAPLGIANSGVGTVQIANGAVNAPKLSTSAIPSAGQVLGFNGANLAWQNAPVGGMRVVDSLGREIGPLVFWSAALRKVGNFTFAIEVVPDGFPDNGPFLYSYATYDCSGTKYLGLQRKGFIDQSRQSGTVLEYVTGPFEQVTINSYEDGASKFCIHFPNHDTNTYGRGATIDLSTLGLIPPFHLEF